MTGDTLIDSTKDTLINTMNEDTPVSSPQGHLIVLVHGLFGKPQHMYPLKHSIESHFPSSEFTSHGIDVYAVHGNAGLQSYDGVRIGGLRIVEEIIQHIAVRESQTNVHFTKLSIIGYSLGGIWARYAIGELYSRGILKNSCANKNVADGPGTSIKWKNKLEPILYTSFATPHLGSKFQGSKVRAKVLNVLGSSLLGYSGRDLFFGPNTQYGLKARTLNASISSYEPSNAPENADTSLPATNSKTPLREQSSKDVLDEPHKYVLDNPSKNRLDTDDDTPILLQLADPDSSYIKGLQLFEKCIAYANAVNDRSVPFHTAYMTDCNPFKKRGHVIKKMNFAAPVDETPEDLAAQYKSSNFSVSQKNQVVDNDTLLYPNTDSEGEEELKLYRPKQKSRKRSRESKQVTNASANMWESPPIIDIKWSRYVADPSHLQDALHHKSSDKLLKETCKTEVKERRRKYLALRDRVILTFIFTVGPIVFSFVFMTTSFATLSSIHRAWQFNREFHLFEQKMQALEDGDADAIEKAIRDKYNDTKADHSVGGDIAEATGKTVEAMASESAVSQKHTGGAEDDDYAVSNTLEEEDEQDNFPDRVAEKKTFDSPDKLPGVPLFDKSVPRLRLTPQSLWIMKNLNQHIVWDKRIVYLHQVNTHAAIVNRLSGKNSSFVLSDTENSGEKSKDANGVDNESPKKKFGGQVIIEDYVRSIIYLLTQDE